MFNLRLTEMSQTWAKNLPAAVVLFLVAVPLNLGVAIASGVPAYLGLISGMIGAVVVGAISGAPLMVSGPDAGIGVLVLEMIKAEGIQSLGVIVCFAGMLQLAVGAIRAANWYRAVSPAVVNGMLGGMGLIIILTQFHIMLDDSPRQTGLENLWLVPSAVIKGLVPVDGLPHHPAACIGTLTIITALLWTKFAKGALKQVPPALVAIVAASLVANVLSLPIQLIELPPDLFGGMQLLGPAQLASSVFKTDIWVCAATLAFVVSAQSLITATAIDGVVPKHKTNFDRELIAQGIGNVICGVLGALPIAGVLLRSMANIQTGATGRTATVMHGVLMMAAVLLVPFVLNYVPTSSLAAVLVLTGYRMVAGICLNVKGYERSELVVLGITVVAILATNLFTGLVIGFICALLKEVSAISHLHIHLDPENSRGHTVLHLIGPATFLQLPKLSSALEAVPDKCELHVRLDELTYIDHACLKLLMDWGNNHRVHGGEFVIDWGEFESRRQSAHNRRRRIHPHSLGTLAELHYPLSQKDAV